MSVFQRYLNWRRNARLSFEENILKQSLFRSVLLLLIIISLHSYLMTLFEGFNWQEALWLTFTTLSTTGYGDISATTAAGKISTVVLLYLGGIFILAKVAGDYFEYRTSIRLKKMHGFWEWKMAGHILIINTPSQNGEQFFTRLLEHLHNSGMQSYTVQILTQYFPNGLPNQLAKMSGLIHYTGSGTNPDDLLAVNAVEAQYIIILAKHENDRDSDSRSFDILHRLQELELRKDALILAECVDDGNRKRFRKAGAQVLMRPMRAYPEMLVRGLVTPGSEQIIENLFSSLDDLYLRYEVDIKQLYWKDIVSQLIQQDFGVAMAYFNADTGLVQTNPHANIRISTQSLFMMVNDDKLPTAIEIQQTLAKIA